MAVIEWAALGHAAWVSFAAALLLVLTFTSGVVVLAPRDDAREVGLARHVVAWVVFGVCAAALAYGLWVLFTQKS